MSASDSCTTGSKLAVVSSSYRTPRKGHKRGLSTCTWMASMPGGSPILAAAPTHSSSREDVLLVLGICHCCDGWCVGVDEGVRTEMAGCDEGREGLRALTGCWSRLPGCCYEAPSLCAPHQLRLPPSLCPLGQDARTHARTRRLGHGLRPGGAGRRTGACHRLLVIPLRFFPTILLLLLLLLCHDSLLPSSGTLRVSPIHR